MKFPLQKIPATCFLMSDGAAQSLLANMVYKNFTICVWPAGDHRCALGAQAAPGPGDGPLLVQLNSMMFHADVIYVCDTWLVPKGSGPAALPGVPQHGLRSELAGLPTVASSMTDAWIIRWFKRPSLLFHSRRYLRRAPRSRIRTARRGSLAA